MFHQLERNDLVKIVDLEVAKVVERVRGKDIKVQLDRGAVEFLINKGYEPIYGARPMRLLWRNSWKIRWQRSFAREHQAGRQAGGTRRW
jgi:ATP-dependent Clp protease ATP-binding subunit ClpA